MPASETLDRKSSCDSNRKTDNPEQDKAVASVVRRGFMRGERILREEEISLYRYTQEDDAK